jgi:cytochrome c oxidase subunit 4
MSSNEAHADHGPLFTKVMWALMGLTVLTVGLSLVHFGSHSINIGVGVLVAVVKATLVVLFFMHLKWEKRWWLGMVLFPVLLVLIIIGLNIPDTGANPDVLTPALKVTPQAGKAGGGH